MLVVARRPLSRSPSVQPPPPARCAWPVHSGRAGGRMGGGARRALTRASEGWGAVLQGGEEPAFLVAPCRHPQLLSVPPPLTPPPPPPLPVSAASREKPAHRAKRKSSASALPPSSSIRQRARPSDGRRHAGPLLRRARQDRGRPPHAVGGALGQRRRRWRRPCCVGTWRLVELKRRRSPASPVGMLRALCYTCVGMSWPMRRRGPIRGGASACMARQHCQAAAHSLHGAPWNKMVTSTRTHPCVPGAGHAALLAPSLPQLHACGNPTMLMRSLRAPWQTGDHPSIALEPRVPILTV